MTAPLFGHRFSGAGSLVILGKVIVFPGLGHHFFGLQSSLIRGIPVIGHILTDSGTMERNFWRGIQRAGFPFFVLFFPSLALFPSIPGFLIWLRHEAAGRKMGINWNMVITYSG